MSESNVQLFPGVFRTTQGGSNSDFFLHSAGRVGIGNDAPGDVVPPGSSSGTFKLNVTGHANISGTMQANKYYGDGSNLSGIAAVVGGYWDLDQANNNIKYDVGNVGIGGAASSTNELKVHGTVEATDLTVSGNVGIGGDPGTEKLKVHGAMTVQGQTRTSSPTLVKTWNAFNNNSSDGEYTFEARAITLAHFHYSGGEDPNISESYLISCSDSGTPVVTILKNVDNLHLQVYTDRKVRFWAQGLHSSYNSSNFNLRISAIWKMS